MKKIYIWSPVMTRSYADKNSLNTFTYTCLLCHNSWFFKLFRLGTENGRKKISLEKMKQKSLEVLSFSIIT